MFQVSHTGPVDFGMSYNGERLGAKFSQVSSLIRNIKSYKKSLRYFVSQTDIYEMLKGGGCDAFTWALRSFVYLCIHIFAFLSYLCIFDL